jgi:hypothetical protein
VQYRLCYRCRLYLLVTFGRLGSVVFVETFPFHVVGVGVVVVVDVGVVLNVVDVIFRRFRYKERFNDVLSVAISEILDLGQCCKTFCGSNLRIFVISLSIGTWKAFPAKYNVCE